MKCHRVQRKAYSKFWEELIAYFPLIQYGPQRKRKKIRETESRVISQTDRETDTQRGDLISPLSFFMNNESRLKSRDSSVGIATGFGLNGRGVRVPSPSRGKIFLLSKSSRPVLGPIQRHFFFFGATAPIWALAHLHETLRFTSIF
jgi:hypothetical protein